jgi:hypothetical protein
MADEEILSGYQGDNEDLNYEGLSLRDAWRRLNQVEAARSRLIQQGQSFTRSLRAGWGPKTKAAMDVHSKAYAGTLASLDKERAALMRLITDLQRNQLLAQKAAFDIEAKNLPYQLMMQQQTKEQNRKTFESLVRHAAGLEEGAPLPPITQKYYAESLIDPQKAANSVARELAVAKMQAEWPETVDKVAAAMRQQLGRPLTDQERMLLAKGDLRTIVEGNQLLNTESYRKLREIPVNATVDISPVHMFAHGYREMKDADGRTFWGRYEKTPEGTVNVIKLTPTGAGLVQEKVGFGQFIPGRQVPGEIFSGKDQGATPAPGGLPGLFQGPDGRYFYRTYTGMGEGIVKQDIPIHQVQTVSMADLLKPATIAQAGLTFHGSPNEPPPEAKAYMVLDALNKANLAQGKQVAYVLSPDESAKAKAAFQAYTGGLREFGEDLLRGQSPAPTPGQPPAPAPQPGEASLRESLVRTWQGMPARLTLPEAQYTGESGITTGLRALGTKIFGTPESWEKASKWLAEAENRTPGIATPSAPTMPTASPSSISTMREEPKVSAPMSQGAPVPSLGAPPLTQQNPEGMTPTETQAPNLSQLRNRILQNPYEIRPYRFD